jgi:hypothetical protein
MGIGTPFTFKTYCNMDSLYEVVSPSTAQKMKNNGFHLPDYLAVQWVREPESGRISHLGKFLEEKSILFLPNAHVIMEKMDGWAELGPDFDGVYRCFLVALPEMYHEDKNRAEAWAKAWMALDAKQDEVKG